MDRKKPTDILEEEHKIIQKVVAAMAVGVEVLETGKDVKADTVRNIVEFMRTFGDKCHHGKEEVYLFPLLGHRGVPMHGCPLAVLIHEHEMGRVLVKELASAGEAYGKKATSAKAALIQSLKGLIKLYPDHIWKENYLLFPMTNKVLSEEDQKDLYEKFEEVERSIGEDTHERFEKMAEKLSLEMQPI
ncbi:MAG: hemerythrin domain-containing protein [Candidatus Omnitrophica bacterium]|nr:hemerythrin domain-containing protein [Candidatus Omnitrophota bacterium]MDD5670736.1 hemerythrin domain-containing protein [Candidatus Omnitrophota bacterium]